MGYLLSFTFFFLRTKKILCCMKVDLYKLFFYSLKYILNKFDPAYKEILLKISKWHHP